MKKTFLVMLMAGRTMGMFAQTIPTTSPTTPTTNTNVTNSTTDPLKTTTNPSLSNNTITATGNTVNNGNWNNGTPPSWNWRSYGIWEANTDNSVHAVDMNAAATTDMKSTNNYSAYSPVENASIPWNVQNNYSKEYPTAYAFNGTWSQYGDWFYTTYMSNGRYSQIYYDNRGRGYSLALPVLNTYVTENIVASALQKYGSDLYSITTLKSSEGKDVYQISLLDRGQIKTEWLNDDGSSAMNIYRIDEINTASADMNSITTEGTMITTEANAAMDSQPADAKKTKTKILNEDGSKTKIKTKNGKTKVKEIPASQVRNEQ